MKTLPSCLCILGLATGTAMGGATVLMDQIGLDDGSGIDTSNMLANQYFEASFSSYDIGCVDDFDNSAGLAGASMQIVIGGWNGYTGIAGVSGLQVNFYDDYVDAGNDLAGYTSETFMGTPTPDPNWGLAGYDLVGVYATAGWVINPGTAYTAMIPFNEFGTNGQTGAAIGFDGNLQSWQCNPNGGFGFGAYQEMPNNIALRVLGGSGDPCEVPLPLTCNADISGPAGVPDGVVGVDDVLAVIGDFGAVGDGESRPIGDCAPMPAGDCLTNVDDLLEVIGQYGQDCAPRGACCYGVDGCTDDVTEADCMGSWLGQGSSCASCVSGACCMGDGTCMQAVPDACSTAGGAYQGDSSACIDITCGVAPDNDQCSGAISIGNGDTGIDCTNALSNGPDNFGQGLCEDFGSTMVYNDIWYAYTADCDGLLVISTCNQVDFDSRLAVYDVCGGTLLACNDDAEGCAGNSSFLSMDVTNGQYLVIQVGRWSEGAGTPSTGVMSVNCEIPSEGACCVGSDCYDLLPGDCADFGGVYQGAGTACATTECGVNNNDCGTATEVACPSSTSFDTSDAFDSGFGEPDESQCAGTYLEWLGSPDVWFKVTPTTAGTMDVSLCDSASYDTSLVLYEGNDCGSLTQVGCNGDSTVETGCQSYYSGIYGHPVVAGTTYYIRIGGWQGATGPGTLNLTCVGADAQGACCVEGDCVGDNYTASACAGVGGVWYADQLCADVDCPTSVSCATGNGQDPILPDGAWTAGTSDTGSGYLRAMDISGGGVADITVGGLGLVYSGGWSACSDPGATTMQYDLMDSGFNSLASGTGSSYAPTNLSYAGIYPLGMWTLSPAYSGSAASVSIASQSGGQGECWFLWMSSTASGEGTSWINDGTGYAAELFGLNYCITE